MTPVVDTRTRLWAAHREHDGGHPFIQRPNTASIRGQRQEIADSLCSLVVVERRQANHTTTAAAKSVPSFPPVDSNFRDLRLCLFLSFVLFQHLVIL